MNLIFRLLVPLSLLLLGGCLVDGKRAPMNGTVPSQQMDSPHEMEALEAGPIQWHVGDRWLYSDGYALRVAEVTEGGAKLVRSRTHGFLNNSGNDWIVRQGLFKIKSLTGDTIRQVIYRSPDPSVLFPLNEGNQVTFKREYISGKTGLADVIDLKKLETKQLRSHQTSWAVLGKERISVPAGVFDCWVLEWKTKSVQSDWEGYEKWWYSPKAGNYVRLEYQYGKKTRSSRVLMDYFRG